MRRRGARPSAADTPSSGSSRARSSRVAAERRAQLGAVRRRGELGQRLQRGIGIGRAADRGDHRRRRVVDRRVAPLRPTTTAGGEQLGRALAVGEREPGQPQRAAAPRAGLSHRRAGAARHRQRRARGGQLGGQRGADRGRIGHRRGDRGRHAARRRHRVGIAHDVGERDRERLPDLDEIVVDGDRAVDDRVDVVVAELAAPRRPTRA